MEVTIGIVSCCISTASLPDHLKFEVNFKVKGFAKRNMSIGELATIRGLAPSRLPTAFDDCGFWPDYRIGDACTADIAHGNHRLGADSLQRAAFCLAGVFACRCISREC
jgi:hypothetical protein